MLCSVLSAAARAEVSAATAAFAASMFDCRVVSAALRAFDSFVMLVCRVVSAAVRALVSFVSAVCSEVRSAEVAAPGAPSPTRLQEVLSLLQI